jgi:hypothetical protein
MARNRDAGVRGFVPGLVLGLVIGAFAGAVLPPLLTERLPAGLERPGASDAVSERRDAPEPTEPQPGTDTERADPESGGDEPPERGEGSAPETTGGGGG